MKKQLFVLATITAFGSGSLEGVRAASSLGGQIVVPDSGVESPENIGRQAHTTYKLFIPSDSFEAHKPAAGIQPKGLPPYSGYTYETPASLGCVYGLDGSGQAAAAAQGCNPNLVTAAPNSGQGAKAIAIVDAFHYPTAEADLATFSAQFGLPAPTSRNFQVVFASASQPRVNSSWNIEEGLDIEWAHAMAPKAFIYLVEANSSSYKDLMAAVSIANSLIANGGGEVSMSWGGSEFMGQLAYDSTFSASNVVYFAASGDSPGVIWPSSSPNVVSVGGTSTDRSPNTTGATTLGNFIGQTTWQSGGGGPSAYELQPSYQTKAITGFTTRATPDVAADANQPYDRRVDLRKFKVVYRRRH